MSYVEKFLAFVQDNKEFFGFVAAVIGLIAAIVGRKQVVIHRDDIKSTPIPPTPHSAAIREAQLGLLTSLKRALGALIVCLIGLLTSIAGLWYFAKEMSAYIQSHGPVTFDGQHWGQGVVIFALLVVSYLGLATWGILGLVQFGRAVLVGWQYYRSR